MQPWKAIVLGALAAHTAGAADLREVYRLMQQPPQHHMEPHGDRPPTQPIHRSILSNRKRRVLQSPGSGALSNNDNNSQPQDEPLGKQSSRPAEPTPPLLTAGWWVRVSEETGQNVWNYAPESRRAASSAIYTYKVHREGRGLEENEDGVEEGSDQASVVAKAGLEEGGDGASVATTASETENKQTVGANTNGQVEQGAEETDSATTTATATSNKEEHTSKSPKKKHKGSTSNAKGDEYMIISGGYTDHDWATFPVYAFPITSTIRTMSGQWIDLSSSDNFGQITVDSNCTEEDSVAARDKLHAQAQFLDAEDDEDPWEEAQSCAPTGRMGHASTVHNDKLYVFGGLIYDEEQASTSRYRKESFRLEDVPFVYRLDLKEMFEARRAESEGRTPPKVTGWQRIVPRVKPFPTSTGMSSTSAAEVLLTSINRGEMQGGLWSDSTGDHDKFVMYGGLRIAQLEYEGYGHNDPSKFVKGETTFGSTSQHSHKIVELPLGDAWAYDLEKNCWEKITNSYGRPVKDGVDVESSDEVAGEPNDASKAPPTPNTDDSLDDDWIFDDISAYPRPRTAHAATVVGNELIIHGGMGWNERTNDWDGSTDWETLDDMWILDLTTREWRRRFLFPSLVRSYHTLVGWSMEDSIPGWGKDFGFANYTSWEGSVVAAFGGYTTGIDVFSGEELAYVFDDLLISYPPPPKSALDNPLSPWLKVHMKEERDGAEMISTRYEHSAVLSREGVLVVWGGSFSNTKSIKGIWFINVAGEDSTLQLTMAQADEIFNDYERTITALHTIVIMLMFMSISLTLLLGLTQRYQELVQQANDEAAVAAGMALAGQDGVTEQRAHRGNGLHPEIIDTLPRKLYSSSENEGDGAEDCCPICMDEYQEGDELRVLPCSHAMHVACLDAWLLNHPSCPSCRHSLSELVDDRPMMQLRTLRSRLSTNSALARFLQSHSEEGIELGEISIPRETVIDFRYITSLDLTEEDADAEATEDQGSDLASQRPARIPLADVDDE
ncbi:hypothetical protein ACHAXT_002360 [Thalassiosira profunda]